MYYETIRKALMIKNLRGVKATALWLKKQGVTVEEAAKLLATKPHGRVRL